MRKTARVGTIVMVALASALTGAVANANPATTVRSVCGAAAPGYARCFAEVRTDTVRARSATALPAGYGPADLHSAYNLPTTGGQNQTVGIVDAGDDPNAEADLAVYRSTYGLPACTTANGCFRKVNQRGATSPLPPDQGWAIEIALDVDMVSAACPLCHIVLVEGDDASFQALATSVDTAVSLGSERPQRVRGELQPSRGGDRGFVG
jgi:subtilase family serine protease